MVYDQFNQPVMWKNVFLESCILSALVFGGFYLNAAQLQPEIDQTLNAASEVFPILVEALDTKTVADRLECSPQRDYFRRMVR